MNDPTHKLPPRWFVYEHMPAVAVDLNATPTATTRRQANEVFELLDVAGYKRDEKCEWLAHLLHAGKRANYILGCVMLSRDFHHNPPARLQVADAVVRRGFFHEERSPPGAPKMTRLIPLARVTEIMEADPWTFDPPENRSLVVLRQRGEEKCEIRFNPIDPFPADVQRRLEQINAVNTAHEITYRPYDEWNDCHRGSRRLRPIHRAIFTDNWDYHGRLYTDRYGHQSLRKIERATIQFDREPSEEIDFAGLHTRMLYHLAGMDFHGDPYALWGGRTTPARREIAKAVINTAINAPTRQAAICACNYQMSLQTPGGTWKTGNDALRAITLLNATRQSKLTFANVYDLALNRHSRIADQFGSDAGMRLMRIDGEIALNVMSEFAERNVPVLGCHDSFVVQQRAAMELQHAMTHHYEERLAYRPTTTKTDGRRRRRDDGRDRAEGRATTQGRPPDAINSQ